MVKKHLSSVEAEMFLGKGVKYLPLWVILEHKRLRFKWLLESEEYACNQWFAWSGALHRVGGLSYHAMPALLSSHPSPTNPASKDKDLGEEGASWPTQSQKNPSWRLVSQGNELRVRPRRVNSGRWI